MFYSKFFIWGGTASNWGGLALQCPPVATRLGHDNIQREITRPIVSRVMYLMVPFSVTLSDLNLDF